MKSLQDYINTYRTIADGLGIKGDSSELLIQLLANASYISEVENISYSQEASLERATMINSKIQHCVDNMYSVFRGQCPRVILNIKPTKMFTWAPFDEIISSNNFKVYYLGIFNNETLDFEYNTITLYPTETCYQVIGLLAKDTAVIQRDLVNTNKYYIDFLENDLSNDMMVTMDNSNKEVTRVFSDHVLNNKIFDLTLPGLGSRLYFNDLSVKNNNSQNQVSNIKAFYFKLSKLSSYNESELKKLNIKGTELVSFNELVYQSSNNDTKLWTDIYTELTSGIIVIPEVESDDLFSVHYKANQVRHLGMVFKSNSDLGDLLQQVYPGKVKDTSVVFDDIENRLYIYYIPKINTQILSNNEIINFSDKYKAYYIANDINVSPGVLYNINFDIEVELYETGDISETIKNILGNYSNKFNTNFIKNSQNAILDKNSVYSEIEAQISKLALVKKIKKFNLQYSTESGELFEENLANDLWNLMSEDLLQKKAYYKISSTISQVI